MEGILVGLDGAGRRWGGQVAFGGGRCDYGWINGGVIVDEFLGGWMAGFR